MIIREFSFSNALTYFTQAPGPRGFIWKHMLGHGATLSGFGILVTVIVPAFTTFVFAFPMLAIFPFILDMFDDFGLVRGFFPDENLFLWWGLLFSVASLSLALWAVHEAAIQRRMVRGDGYRLRFGWEETRIMVVGFVMALITALTIAAGAFIVVILIRAADQTNNNTLTFLTAIISSICYFLIVLLVWVRLSAASALTIRDKRLRLTGSFVITRRYFWQLFGSYLIIHMALWSLGLIAAVFYFGIFNLFVASSGIWNFGEFVILPIFFLVGFFYYAGLGLVNLVLAGPAALATINDPNWDEAIASQVDVFS